MCNLVHNPQAKYCDLILYGNVSNQVHFTWGSLLPFNIQLKTKYPVYSTLFV